MLGVKRRKKIWIACAALAVVVALCAFALFYRSSPYQFLRGATLVSIDVASEPFSIPRPPDRTYFKYRLRGAFAGVVAAAREELAPKDGWEEWTQDEYSLLTHDDRGEVIVATKGAWGSKKDRFAYEPGTIQVLVVRPTTTLDRVLAWMHNR